MLSDRHMLLSEATNETEYRRFLSYRGLKAARALKEMRDRGEAVGIPPLGLRVRDCPDGVRRFGPDPATWPLVKESVLRYREGSGLRPLLAEMTGRGLRSRNGKVIGVSAFRYLVKNEAYKKYT